MDNNGDDWIWGNSRGGCGAPLKDSSGNVVTNLRLAIKGSQSSNISQNTNNSNDNYNGYNQFQQQPPPQQQSLSTPGHMKQQNYFNQPSPNMSSYPQQQQYQLSPPQIATNNYGGQYDPNNGGFASPSNFNNNNNNNNDNGATPGGKRFMSALRDMNSNPGERDEKQRLVVS